MERLSEITSKVEGVFNDYMDFFKGQESTSKVLLSSECHVPNVSGTTYLEILLKEDMLNEKDIDLLTIEINYDIKDGASDVRGEFYGSDGVILKDFHHHTDEKDINGIEKALVSFMEGIKNEYDDILKEHYVGDNHSKQTCGALLENVNLDSYTDSVGWLGYYSRKCQYSHALMNESIEQFINFFKGIVPKISVITSLYKYETDSESWRLLRDSEWDGVRKLSSVVMYNDGDVAGHCFIILEALDLIAYPHDDTGFGFISNASNHNSAAIVKALFEGLDTSKFMYEL